MPEYPVSIKHAGRTHPLPLNTDLPATAFKQAIYEATGVPVDRMKVMVKGGVLKDDHDWAKLAVKANQSFMVIGAAGPLPKAPEKPTVFLEDMDDADLASALATPVGLKNLGNTCYMNATVQAMRAIPELQRALAPAGGAGPSSRAALGALPTALRDLYAQMARTTDGVLPLAFLSALRAAVPQFGEVSRAGKGAGAGAGPAYAQQDAEECWGALTNALKDVPGLPGAESEEAADQAQAEGAGPRGKFIEQFLMAEMRRELKCDEAPEEPPTVVTEKVLKIECNISITTNFMASGIKDALDQKVDKNSPSLGREAVYTQVSRLSRLPSYLTVHMVRFAWRRDIGKKAKIMRKVKFPAEYDALDLVTDDLRAALAPVNGKLRELERERAERRKVRRRTRAAAATAASSSSSAPADAADVEMADVGAAPPAGDVAGEPAGEAGAEGAEGAEGKGKAPAGAALEDEGVYRARELRELEALVSPALKRDVGCSVTGLYDLVAIVTHKGAAADAGHYIGFVKKSVFHPTASASAAGAGGAASSSSGVPLMVLDDEDEDWYKFDDDKVSIFPKEKLATLDGGGEDASAYLLLYKSKSLS